MMCGSDKHLKETCTHIADRSGAQDIAPVTPQAVLSAKAAVDFEAVSDRLRTGGEVVVLVRRLAIPHHPAAA